MKTVKKRMLRRAAPALTLVTLLLWMGHLENGAAQKPPLSWKLPSLSGETISFENLRGKVVVVSFGATWCPPCREELPALQELADRYQGKGVQVFWISVDERKVSDDQLRQFAVKFGLKIPVLRDPQSMVYDEIGDGSVPIQIIIGKDGRVAGAPQVGFSNRVTFLREVSSAIDRLL